MVSNASVTIETLRLQPGGSVTLSPFAYVSANLGGTSLHIPASAILVLPNPGNPSSINGGWIESNMNGWNDTYFHCYGDLNFNSRLIWTTNSYAGGLEKDGSGTLTIGIPQLLNSRSLVCNDLLINGGTVKIGAGDFTLEPSLQTTGITRQSIAVNPGSTLDLNGTKEVALLMSSNGASLYTMSGGLITNSSTTPATLYVDQDTTETYIGQINNGAGTVTLDKVHTANLILTGSSNYTGPTTVRGGTLQLIDGGQLTGSTAIGLYYGTLDLSNAGLGHMTNRIPAGATVAMKGAIFQAEGAQGQFDSLAVGTMNITQGFNQINMTGGSIGRADLTITNLNVSPNAVVQFANNQLALPLSDPTGLGPNTTQATHVFITNLNLVGHGSPVTLTNGMIGGWALVGDNFASYDPTLGVGPMGGANAYPVYSNALLTMAGPTDVINQGVSIGGVTTRTIYTLRTSAASTIAMASSTNTLTIASGGFSTSSATYFNNGKLTAGTAADTAATLYMNTVAGTTQVNSRIVNNGSGLLTLVKSGAGTLSLTGLGGNAAYTGGTVVNGGVLSLDGVPGRSSSAPAA